MGSLFIEVGQCGCQIGAKLNPLLSNSYYCTRNRTPYRLHSIMIDTEPKVLKAYEQKTPKWLDLDNIKYFEHGRGNNWSYGYLHEIPPSKINTGFLSEYRQFSHNQENKLLKVYVEENKRISDFVLQKVRKQLETIDCAMAINVISSLGGEQDQDWALRPYKNSMTNLISKSTLMWSFRTCPVKHHYKFTTACCHFLSSKKIHRPYFQLKTKSISNFSS